MDALTPPEMHEAISRQRLQMLDQIAAQEARLTKALARIAELEAALEKKPKK